MTYTNAQKMETMQKCLFIQQHCFLAFMHPVSFFFTDSLKLDPLKSTGQMQGVGESTLA